MTDDVQSPMEDAARDLVDADPGWRYTAEAIMAGVDALIGMRARLDRAAALEAGLRELEARRRDNDALRAMVADAERRGDHIELLRSTIFWELRESHARQVAALLAEHGSES